MQLQLLESQGAPGRRRGGTTLSVLAHAALIAAAVAGTARSRPGVRIIEMPAEVIYHAPTRPPDAPRPSGPTAPTAGPTTPNPLPRIPLPIDIVPGVPPVDVAVPRLPMDGDVVLGGPSGRDRAGSGGFETGPAYGAPDASGAWDARAVEVAVVPAANNPVPTYPELLRSGGIGGRVVAEFVVDSTGRVRAGSLVIVEATHPLFAASVRRTVPGFRFTPARVQGRHVAQRVRVPFEFEMRR